MANGRSGKRRLLIFGVISSLLTLALLASTIANPVWYHWLGVVAGLCTTSTFFLTYRQSRTR